MKDLLLALPAGQESRCGQFGLTPAHMAYRIGPGPRLLGVQAAAPPQGGLMSLDCRDFEGGGDPTGCCRQIIGECRRRAFRGVVCDFEGPPLSCLGRLAALLVRECGDLGWPVYLPETYASFAPSARVLIPSAVTSGTLERRLRAALERYSPERLALAVEWLREDFPLPSDRRGDPITQETLDDQLQRLEPAVFFDRGLCAHYYTYMAANGQAHFVLFDTPRSIREKLSVARRLGLAAALLPGPEVEPCLEEIFPADGHGPHGAA